MVEVERVPVDGGHELDIGKSSPVDQSVNLRQRDQVRRRLRRRPAARERAHRGPGRARVAGTDAAAVADALGAARGRAARRAARRRGTRSSCRHRADAHQAPGRRGAATERVGGGRPARLGLHLRRRVRRAHQAASGRTRHPGRRPRTPGGRDRPHGDDRRASTRLRGNVTERELVTRRGSGEWPRMESNHRTQIRSLPLYPLSYGAVPGQGIAAGTRRPRGSRTDGWGTPPAWTKSVTPRPKSGCQEEPETKYEQLRHEEAAERDDLAEDVGEPPPPRDDQ